MISELASPSVCVIDDEPDDYAPILGALNNLYVSCVHLTGAVDELPANPFSRVRLVFLDLHLSASLGKAYRRVGIVGVLDQFKNGEACVTDELFAK